LNVAVLVFDGELSKAGVALSECRDHIGRMPIVLCFPRPICAHAQDYE
jgi:hypothetical protein